MLTTYQECELVFGTIFFGVFYTTAYNALNPHMDLANVFITTAIFAFIFWLSTTGSAFFTYNKTQTLDTPSANEMIQPLP